MIRKLKSHNQKAEKKKFNLFETHKTFILIVFLLVYLFIFLLRFLKIHKTGPWNSNLWTI